MFISFTNVNVKLNKSKPDSFWQNSSIFLGPNLIKVHPFGGRILSKFVYSGAEPYIEVMSFDYQFNCVILSVNVKVIPNQVTEH